MPTRKYKLAAHEPGRSDDTIVEIIANGDGSERVQAFMAIMPRTPPETRYDIVEALRRAYQAGREDRSEELLPEGETGDG